MTGGRRMRRLFSLGILRSDAASEVTEELEFHLDETVRSLMASGLSRDEAEQEAERRFGDRDRYQRELERSVRRRVSAERASEWVGGVLRDVRYAARALRRSPTFTLGVVGTLAVAIAATTVMVSIVNGVLVRPLPFPDADRVVRVFDTQLERGSTSSTSSPANFVDWRAQSHAFRFLAAHVPSRSAYNGVVPAEDLAGFRVSAEWFDVLGVQPMVGRTFRRDEEIYGNDRVVIVSADFWQRFLRADSSIVGKTIDLDGTPLEVIGVMPPGFAYPSNDVAIWRPLSFDFDVSTSRGVHYIYVIGRLADGQTIASAEAELGGIMAGLREQYPERLEGWGVRLVSMREWLVGNAAQRLLLFLGAVVLLLLVAVGNVSNMMVVRAITRAREMAIRAAIGAGRWRLIRQLLAEGVALSLVAATAGILLGRLGLDVVKGTASGNIPRVEQVSLDLPLVALIVVVAIVLGILLGTLPSLAVSRMPIETAVTGGSRASSGSRTHHRIRDGFVVVQIAMAMLLAIGAGLLIRSFSAMVHVDPGYRTERAWTATVAVPGERYPEAAARSQFFQELVDRVQRLPGVRAAAATTQLPLEFYGINFSFWRDGQELQPNEQPNGDFRVVTSGYFATMGIPVLRGRGFERSDRPDGEPVIVIDQTLAARYFPGENPIGQFIHISYGGGDVPRRIVGVVGGVRQRTLDTPESPGYYLPLQQVTWSSMRLVVQTDIAPLALTRAVRREVAAMDPLIPVRDIRTLQQRFDAVVGSSRFSAFLLAVCASIATLVAAAGIYGVTSYTVAQRTRDIGVRMALGAQAGRVRRSVAAGVIKRALAGIVLGYAAGIAATRLLGGLLFQVSPTDFPTFVLAGAAFLLIAWLGGYLPARRASAVDPVAALRAD